MTRSGVTGGTDLATETLELIAANWDTNNYDPQPILHHRDEGKRYPKDGRSTYVGTATVGSSSVGQTEYDMPLARDGDLRQNNIVTVSYEGRTTDPVGTEFDFDVEAEVDIAVEGLTADPAPIPDAEAWRELVDEVRRAVLETRHFPIVDPSCRYSYRWLSFTEETDEPFEEENRNRYNTRLSLSWYGYEDLPDI